MNRIEISVLRPEEALRACAEVWHAVQAGDELTLRLAFGSLHELFLAITEKRLELLRHVAGHPGLNIRQLAQALIRDYKNVHTDVSELIELGLLERNDSGGLLVPYDEIVIHADISAVALGVSSIDRRKSKGPRMRAFDLRRRGSAAYFAANSSSFLAGITWPFSAASLAERP